MCRFHGILVVGIIESWWQARRSALVTLNKCHTIEVQTLLLFQRFRMLCSVQAGDRGCSAIAWGQAIFFGDGIVTPGTLGKVGLGFMGRQYRWMLIKGAAMPHRRASKNITEKSEPISSVQFVSSQSRLPQVRRLPQAPVLVRVPSSRRDHSSPAMGCYICFHVI